MAAAAAPGENDPIRFAAGLALYVSVIYLIATMAPAPWFPDWNYGVLQTLFAVLPHKNFVDASFEFIDRNRLVSTWPFAVAFYLFWRIEDARTESRRARLLQIIVAFAIAVAISFAVRPWIGWPAPALQPRFRALYPKYFWGDGTNDSFPSHSTLTYFLIAMGLWPLSKRISIILCLLVVPLVIAPRLYVGGHYPIDVVASLVLVVPVVLLVWQWRVPARIAGMLSPSGARPLLRETLVLLWVFELAQEFGGVEGILGGLRHYL